MANYSVAWDETTPAGTESRALGDDRIRELKAQLRERFTTEHGTITGSSGDALLIHLPGQTSVLYVGTTAQIAAITPTTTAQGPIAFDTTLKCFKYWSGSAWTAITLDWDNVWDDAVHAHNSNAEGGALAGIKMLATPVNHLAATADQAFTDVDISASVGSDTVVNAILQVEVSITTSTAAEFNQVTVKFRNDGSAITDHLPRVVAKGYRISALVANQVTVTATIIVPVTSNIFECYIETDSGTPSSISVDVDLVGYTIL